MTASPQNQDPEISSEVEVLSHVLRIFEPASGAWSIFRKNRRILLALPRSSEGAGRALQLYQPQRRAAKLVTRTVKCLADLGLHTFLPSFRTEVARLSVEPPLEGIEAGTCGVMLGSPEHRVKRAIASYRSDFGWEVAKIAFGPAGIRGITREAEVLASLHDKTGSAPALLGIHLGPNFALLRMPYLSGMPIPAGETREAMALLDTWKSELPPIPASTFGEWKAIEAALSPYQESDTILQRLARMDLRPVICHGDFARWNLLRPHDGPVAVLDWEWARENGMPGIDLVHYFAQDARLVQRLNPKDSITATIAALETPACRKYLHETGWTGSPLDPIIACLAFKQGAAQQDNLGVLKAALDLSATNG